MRVFIGFDDTDHLTAAYGTGKVARWFEASLPGGCRMSGVVRQQLLIHEKVPYTSHNSAACMVVHVPDAALTTHLIDRASAHIGRHALQGSDPGLCVALENGSNLARLVAFGRKCAEKVVTQKEAVDAAADLHLSGHGGTNDGIIGAAAAVGLTASGWCGRFIECGRLRDFPDIVRVSDLERSEMLVVSLDRDARVPGPEDLVYTKGWVRPRLWGGRAVLPVNPKSEGVWESAGKKRKNRRSEGRSIAGTGRIDHPSRTDFTVSL